ncbi:hypothetical protein [Saccharomonospora iraqiensis]|uniref:hypothetical protein n=1 Tax=Saccharomonospora iraqiensis TaxID=52698 RepID=UPI00022E24BA|nr:hypothetical protein [Saccharomonospora iraqiensis]
MAAPVPYRGHRQNDADTGGEGWLHSRVTAEHLRQSPRSTLQRILAALLMADQG